VKLDLVVAHARSMHRHALGVSLVLALSACGSDDGTTGLPSSLLEVADIVIAAVDPDTATIDTTITVRITGSGFTDGSTATWLIDTTAATQIRTVSTTWKSPTEIEVRIAISPDAELRTYSIRIRGKKGKQGIAVERFRVVAKPTPLPEPGTRSEAYDINDSGVIVGSANDMSGAFVAMRWTPADSGWTYSILGEGTAVAINDEGLILRRIFDGLARTDRSWIHLPSGAVVDFGPVFVEDISNDGTIIGSIRDVEQNSTTVVWRRVSPSSWGPPQPLPVPAGFTGAWLDLISGTGIIAGVISSTESTFNVVWRYSDGQWLMPETVDVQLPAGAAAINDAGAIAGYVLPCDRRLPNCYGSPAFWSSLGGTRKMLPTLYNTLAFVSGMNNANQVVGEALVHFNDGSGAGPVAALVWHAVIWFPGSQWPEDLGAIQPSFPGEAVAINNHGWVVGWMSKGDGPFSRHAIVWKLPDTYTSNAPPVAVRR
jgi:hypothetical protein